MRVIAGQAGGRRLVSAKGVRPTSGRVREALFSSLQGVVTDAVVLDLWAGTGALGLEARSRGAARVVLVERDRGALAAVRRNIDAVGLGGVTVRSQAVGDFCRAPDDGPFDLVLCDPPYATAWREVSAALDALRAAGALTSEAVVVIERDRDDSDRAPPNWLAVHRTRSYGDTVVHIGGVRGGPAAGDDSGERSGEKESGG